MYCNLEIINAFAFQNIENSSPVKKPSSVIKITTSEQSLIIDKKLLILVMHLSEKVFKILGYIATEYASLKISDVFIFLALLCANSKLSLIL